MQFFKNKCLLKFYFRRKLVSSGANAIITQKDIVEITSIKPGWDRVLNISQISFDADYYAEYNSLSLPEPTPNSQEIYGDKVYSESSPFLVFYGSDLAAATAWMVHDDNYRARIQGVLTIRAIPHLDVSDVLKITYTEDPLALNPVFGDMLLKFGETSFGADDPRVLFNEKLFKVLGIRYNVDAEKMDVTLEEIL